MGINFKELKEPYLIAEIGINHNGDMQIAKRLIDATFAFSWDCVKFQKREPDICVPKEQKNRMAQTPWGNITYLEYRKRMEFGKAEYDLIDEYCKQKPISWTASVWDSLSLEFISKYNPPFIKIPSAQMTNYELLGKTAKIGIPLIVSTGMSTLEEVDKCVEILNKYNSNFALMHTNSAYPTPEDEVNLRIIGMFKERYKCPVGYSGHEYGLEATAISTAFGAVIIERHITLNHNMWGSDHKASVEIGGMGKLVRRVKGIKASLGSTEKKVMKSEFSIRKKLRGE